MQKEPASQPVVRQYASYIHLGPMDTVGDAVGVNIGIAEGLAIGVATGCIVGTER